MMVEPLPTLEEVSKLPLGCLVTNIGCSCILFTLTTRNTVDFKPYFSVRLLQIIKNQALDQNGEAAWA